MPKSFPKYLFWIKFVEGNLRFNVYFTSCLKIAHSKSISCFFPVSYFDILGVFKSWDCRNVSFFDILKIVLLLEILLWSGQWDEICQQTKVLGRGWWRTGTRVNYQKGNILNIQTTYIQKSKWKDRSGQKSSSFMYQALACLVTLCLQIQKGKNLSELIRAGITIHRAKTRFAWSVKVILYPVLANPSMPALSKALLPSQETQLPTSIPFKS